MLFFTDLAGIYIFLEVNSEELLFFFKGEAKSLQLRDVFERLVLSLKMSALSFLALSKDFLSLL